MDLYTHCPNCNTTFRVTTQQLQASGGQVRCGHCARIFDAFATLTAQEPQRPVLDPPASLASAPHQGALAADSEAPSPSGYSTQKMQPNRPDPAAALYEWEFRMPESSPRTLLWTLCVLLMCMTLAVQAAFAFRSEIEVLLPQSRNTYMRACEALGCTTGLPKLSNYLHIEISDLKALDPSHPQEIQLLLSIRNRAPIELAYPAFELTLTDMLEQSMARRVFLPREYLPSDAPADGFKAGTELPIQLYLDTGTLRAAGYRLYLFYP
ncbi:MAG: zinc-ribbon and DUF3426 domain-containing protein [Betaproteobacteria bacterium]